MVEVRSRLKPATGGIAFSSCTVANVFVALIAVLVLRAAQLEKTSDVYKYVSYLVAPAAISAGCFAVMKYFKQPVREVVKFRCDPVYFIIAFLMAFGLIFCMSETNVLTLGLLRRLGYEPRGDDSYLPSLEGGLVVPALLVIAVIPAAAEEFFFRGVLLQNAREGMGDIRAVFTVGFCFSIFHASAEQTVYQFICGCAFALITIRSGSILPALLIHFTNNAFIISLNALGYSSLPVSPALNAAIIALGGAAFVASVLWLIFIKKPYKKAQKGGVSAFYLCAALGIAANAVIWIFSFFGS